MADNVKTLLDEAQVLATLAVSYDQQKDLEASIYFYGEAIKTLHKYLEQGGELQEEFSQKIDEYQNRLISLQEKQQHLLAKENKNLKLKEESDCSVQRLEFLLKEALDEDEEGDTDEALPLYLEAIETGLKAKKEIKDHKLNERLTSIITQALERAEVIKGIDKTRPKLDKKLNKSFSFDEDAPPSFSKSGHIISGQDSYSKEEIQVLRQSSNINGIDYVPFIAQIDLRERFSTLSMFEDPKGLLALSSKQKSVIVGFRRLSELAENPLIFENFNRIDCYAIKQTIVTDCSFIASLTVASLYERRFSKRLISCIIYPQNRKREPVYNPCGKYMVILHINGILRKVIIDDRLPFSHNGQLLCSFSINKNEFWVSLLEKAYMKVMGGYDFPGSNSNIDLHALTGWIPERIALKETDVDKFFKMISSRYNAGEVLVTFSTGDISDYESERTGLVSTHAYAMLDIQNVQGKRLFLLKNPWSHVRWKGKYSERDMSSWTPELKKALNYDPNSAKNFDNGIFWIDIDSLVNFFDVCYLSWNPSLFKYVYCTHDIWRAGVGPAKDLYYMGDNPQYSLKIKNPDSSTWILLTRHIMDRDDFANNKEYIALIVYKNDGEKSNLGLILMVLELIPHITCENPELRYTLVISQYEKSSTILYSLRAYSTSPFSLKKIPNIYRFKEKEKNGAWTERTAGGCRNHPETYPLNPVYEFTLSGSSRDEDNEVLIELRGPKDYAVGIEVITVSVMNQNSLNTFQRKDSGSFRRGCTYVKIKSIPNGTYQIIPATFLPGKIGPFFLYVHSTHQVQLKKIK
ncbi:calpain-7-like protein [Sarcoptes scabiei]|uniref:Calpain-7-like protein n=1 Tax=Sarcoptes scabiei TaxID=52283 RepID=A0A132AJI2_SARSC|nr:calpain-7-like protein [Sarcoptes scabiei]